MQSRYRHAGTAINVRSENENGRVFISEQSGVEVNRSGESDEKGEAGGPSKSGEAVISGKRSALGESVETGEICETGETSECAKQGSTRSLPCREHSKSADLKNGS